MRPGESLSDCERRHGWGCQGSSGPQAVPGEAPTGGPREGLCGVCACGVWSVGMGVDVVCVCGVCGACVCMCGVCVVCVVHVCVCVMCHLWGWG